MTEYALGERRHHRRRTLGATTVIVVGGARVPVSALDVSVGGATVRTTARAHAGTRVELECEFGGERVTFEAEVVRVERGVLGLRFLALGQRELEALLAAGHPDGVSWGRAAREETDPRRR